MNQPLSKIVENSQSQITCSKSNNTSINAPDQNKEKNDNLGNSKSYDAIVTFVSDDGKIEDWTKLRPIFKMKKVPCVFATITSQVNSKGFLSIDQIKSLQNDLGWEIASHTVSHINMMTLNQAKIDTECKNSKVFLINNGLKVNTIGYPYGGYN